MTDLGIFHKTAILIYKLVLFLKVHCIFFFSLEYQFTVNSKQIKTIMKINMLNLHISNILHKKVECIMKFIFL